MAKKLSILVLIFVVAYLGAHFWIRWRNTVADNATKTARLAECEANGVRAIKIFSNKDGKETVLSFQRKDAPVAGIPPSTQLSFSEWEFLSPEKGEADASILVRVASMFCELYDPIPLSVGDFSSPSASVDRMEVEVQGGENPGTYILHFGKFSSDRMSIVKVQEPGEKEKVYKIPLRLQELASFAPKQYLNMKILRMTADNVQSAKIFTKAKESFSLERSGNGWRVLAGGKFLGNGSVEAEKFLNRLSTLRAIGVSQGAANPASCEENQSQKSVHIVGVAGKKEEIFFQYGKKGPLTACSTARDALFTVHRDFLPYLEVPVKKLLEK